MISISTIDPTTGEIKCGVCGEVGIFKGSQDTCGNTFVYCPKCKRPSLLMMEEDDPDNLFDEVEDEH